MMPEFILKHTDEPVDNVMLPGCVETGLTLDFEDLDAFARGYIEALFFTSEGPGVTTREFRTRRYQRGLEAGTVDGTLPGDVGFADLAPETLQHIMTDCRSFQESAAELLRDAYARPDYSAEQAGRDFWFTRNGHGVGFWDRQQLEAGDLGDKLSTIARAFGEIDAYFGADSRVRTE